MEVTPAFDLDPSPSPPNPPTLVDTDDFFQAAQASTDTLLPDAQPRDDASLGSSLPDLDLLQGPVYEGPPANVSDLPELPRLRPRVLTRE
eukprot:2743847-Heterocapsa_arctica.AAC.1